MEETQNPKLLNDIPEVDYLITMGLDDPSGKNDEEFIKTIKEIESKVHKLIEEVEAN